MFLFKYFQSHVVEMWDEKVGFYGYVSPLLLLLSGLRITHCLVLSNVFPLSHLSQKDFSSFPFICSPFLQLH